MVKVFYRGYPHSKMNAWLGGNLFVEGICEIADIDQGIAFANMFSLEYEVIEEVKKAAKKKRVKADD